MNNVELDTIRRNKLRELQRRLAAKQRMNKKGTEQINVDEVLEKIFRGRALEVFNSANKQFPNTMIKIKDVLVKLAQSGRLSEINGEQLYYFLRKIGLRVRLKTTIRFSEDGEVKSLSEKIREDFRRA